MPKPRNLGHPPHHAVNIAVQSILALTRTQTNTSTHKQEPMTKLAIMQKQDKAYVKSTAFEIGGPIRD
jgi:hypothetical protein